jgi:exonuclease III
MKLNLLTFNVHNLNEDAAVDSLRGYIQDYKPKLDIIAIQEHKMHGEALQRLGTRFWRSTTFWGLEASLGYGHSQFPMVTRGLEVEAFLHSLPPQWSRLISQSDHLLNNRVQWFILSKLPSGDVGIANIYAPNSSSLICELWSALA